MICAWCLIGSYKNVVRTTNFYAKIVIFLFRQSEEYLHVLFVVYLLFPLLNMSRDANRAVQRQKTARDLKLRIYEKDRLYYPCSESKGNCAANLVFVFRIGKNPVFRRHGSYVTSVCYLYSG